MIDVNDNTPTFVNPPSSAHVSEAARPGSNIVQLSANDIDSDFAGRVEYNITMGDPGGKCKETTTLINKTTNTRHHHVIIF